MGDNLNLKKSNFRNDGGGREALTRQGSIYSLTFDEFQSSLGKEFGSMNMDELLKNIWTAEETQAMAMASTSGGIIPVSGGGQESLQLQRQGSLTLPRTLSQKTVDQVWKDLSKDEYNGGGTNMLGEVTLEEFLVRAGVVREEAQIAADANTGFSVGFQQANLGRETANHLPLNLRSTYQQHPIMPKQPYGTQVGQLNIPGIRDGHMGLGDQSLTNNMGLVQASMGVGAGVSPLTPLSSDGIGKGNGDSSSLSPTPYMFNGGARGRKSGGVVERRQRRMIKNRESAARSRTRKQPSADVHGRPDHILECPKAYTVELEAEVAKLKQENEELQRKQAKIMEMQKNQEMEMRNLQGGPQKKLRRTQSGTL